MIKRYGETDDIYCRSINDINDLTECFNVSMVSQETMKNIEEYF